MKYAEWLWIGKVKGYS